jgi:predicted MPP superfamily phosphohydrolase
MKKRIFATFIALVTVLSLCVCFSSCGKEKSYDIKEYRTTMQFYDDFKILQITDLHLGIETDIYDQLELLKNNIREAEPDLIILTGDNFMYASKGVVRSLVDTLNEECKLLTSRRGGRLTKFTLTFGNHDNQGDYPRYFINEVVSSYAAKDGDEIKYSKYAAFIDFENDDIFGLTNFYIDLVDDRTKSLDTVDVKYRVHIIDSNTYHFVGPDYDYDVIHEDQLDHAFNIYDGATSDKDYIGLAFFHIPLYEYQDAWELYKDSLQNGQGEFRENALYGYENNDSYVKLKKANISAFFCGHDHINYGDFIFTEENGDKAIMSYGVKATNQLYHDTDMIGYKLVTLKDNMSKEDFVSMSNLESNFKNVTRGYEHYED